MNEFILCAAIYVDDGVDHKKRNFNYPKTGLVFCGPRHGDCFQVVFAWAKLLPSEEHQRLRDQIHGLNAGFVTSRSRFVDRVEALQIARLAGQVDEPEGRSLYELTSEDLY